MKQLFSNLYYSYLLIRAVKKTADKFTGKKALESYLNYCVKTRAFS